MEIILGFGFGGLIAGVFFIFSELSLIRKDLTEYRRSNIAEEYTKKEKGGM